MAPALLPLTRTQILAHRRLAGALDERLPRGSQSLRRAAWAGLPDSMPRSALLSISARVEETHESTWEDRSLVQIWGPRHNVFVVALLDVSVFTLGVFPADGKGRRRAENLADRLRVFLGGDRMSYREAGRALGVHPNSLRYAAPTGTVLIRWEGAGPPSVWSVPAPEVDPMEARLELTRRYLNVYGPATPVSFGRWAGIGSRYAAAAFDVLASSLIPVQTPVGEAAILAGDEQDFRAAPGPAALARLLPSGDPYLLLWGTDRNLMVTDDDCRRALWTPRVWPGGLLVNGEISGTWRRAGAKVTVHPWRGLSRVEREAVAAEAATFPLPATAGRTEVNWAGAGGRRVATTSP